MHLRRARTVVAATLLTSAALLVTAAGAQAHVTVGSADAVAGGYPVITFRVPTESDTASTTKLSVAIPTDHPLAFVAVQPHPGWTVTVKKTKLARPITTDDGPVTEAVSQIDWVADGGAIKPGEFDQFNVEAGPLPAVASLTFPTVQTYSDGSVVKWIETSSPGSAEPEHPAPVLTIGKAATNTSGASVTASPSDTSADGGKASTGLAVTGLVVGIVGVLLGAAGLGLAARRRRT